MATNAVETAAGERRQKGEEDPRMKPIRIHSIVAALAAATAGLACAAEVTVFKQPQFTGDQLTLRRDTTNLAGAGFQDQISSLVVRSGRWQFCSQPQFNGDCIVLGPGEYPQLAQNMNHRIESAREVSRYARNDRYREGRYEGGGERSAERGAVELFPGADFRGRGLALDHDVDALDPRMVDRGVSSLVVREGRWQACSQPGFRGRCAVFGPGEYADLGRLDNRIGSMRRIG